MMKLITKQKLKQKLSRDIYTCEELPCKKSNIKKYLLKILIEVITKYCILTF
jgi:hypothetical protein